MLPLVSIVIPAYNSADDLHRAIPMVERQTYGNFECVVVDDGSTDETPEVLASLSRERPWLRWVRQENGGAGAARNRGVEESAGEYIAFLDCDDLWSDEAVTVRMSPFLEYDEEEMMGVFCPAFIVDANGDPLVPWLLSDYTQPFDRVYYTALNGSLFNPSCVIVRRSSFERVGGFCQELSPAEDFELWQRMLRTGGCFYKVSGSHVRWVQHPRSTVHTSMGFHYEQCAEVMERLFAKEQEGPWLPELSGTYGQVLARKEQSIAALSHAVMAVTVGDDDTAWSVAKRIRRIFMEQRFPDMVVSQIKFNVLRALCRHEADWDKDIWPEAAIRVIPFLKELDQRIGGSRVMAEVIAQLVSVGDGSK